ncbi:MAG: hypothetical protein M0R06_17900 [Sphaerochaeta sp.]|jgi:hypothetical protein|nr:hypothetical protein [Sphaerochaeta sp.]
MGQQIDLIVRFQHLGVLDPQLIQQALDPEELAPGSDSDAATKAGNFVTIDDRVVFMGGASGGGGGSSAGSSAAAVEEAVPTIDRATELKRLLRPATEPGGLTPQETKQITKWLENVPDKDLVHVSSLFYARDAAALRNLRKTGATYGAQVSMQNGSLILKESSGTNPVNGFYDMRTGTVVLAPMGFNSGTLLHEIGHAVTISQPHLINSADFIVNRFNRQSDSVIAGREQARHLFNLSIFAGLRQYSFSSDLEFLADAYKVRRLGNREQNARLNELIREMGGATAGSLADELQ